MNHKLSDKKYTAKAENGRVVTGTLIWQETFWGYPEAYICDEIGSLRKVDTETLKEVNE